MTNVRSLGLVLVGALAGMVVVAACADLDPDDAIEAGGTAKADDLADAGPAGPGAARPCTRWKVRAMPVFGGGFGAENGAGSIRNLTDEVRIDEGWEPIGNLETLGQSGAVYTVLLRACIR